MGLLNLQRIMSKDMGKRRFFLHPPEPPIEFVTDNPGDSIYLGKTMLLHAPFYWTYKKTTNLHLGVVGVTGSGKSFLVKTFLTRAALVWKTNALILDWAGEYGEWVKQTGGKVLKLGKGDYINLLDLGGMKPADRAKQVINALEMLTSLRPETKRIIETAVEQAYKQKGFDPAKPNEKKPPTLKNVEKILEKNMKKASLLKIEEIEEALHTIKGFTAKGKDYFSQQSTIKFEQLTESGLVCVDLSGLPDEIFRSLAGLTILQFVKERMRVTGWKASKGVHCYIVVDEAWKIASDERSDVITIVREGRKYQFGLIVASQNPTDVHPAILANVGTLFIMRLQLKEHKHYLQQSLNYSNYIQEQIDKFGVGNTAIHMIFEGKTKFSQTFLLDMIHGEEPLVKIKLEVNEMQLEFEKDEFRRKLVEAGLNSHQIKSILQEFEKNDHALNALALVAKMEKYGYSRSVITQFLREAGVTEASLVKTFNKLQRTKLGVNAERMSELVVNDENMPVMQATR